MHKVIPGLLDNCLLLTGLILILQPRQVPTSYVSIGGRVVSSLPLTSNVYSIRWQGVLFPYPFACCAVAITNKLGP